MGLRAKNVLLSIGWSHFFTKMVFLQSSIIKNFFARENYFFHHIFLSQLANKQLSFKDHPNVQTFTAATEPHTRAQGECKNILCTSFTSRKKWRVQCIACTTRDNTKFSQFLLVTKSKNQNFHESSVLRIL